MSVNIKDIALDPPVMLAPMAGITDLPFRNIVASFGAGMVVSEMVASQEMVQAKPGVRERAELGFGHANTAVQLAARDVYWAGEAAKMVEQNGARVIDINMGCPARKVVGGMSGSALMRDLDHAERLIKAIVGAVSVPVTLKTRLGWDDDSLNAATLAQIAEAAGIQLITIHGRTRCQFYKGTANWSAIRPVKDAVTIPVIANGDIVDTKTARQALAESGADGVMIGRGSGGQPWLLAQVAHDIWGSPAPVIPHGNELANLVVDHYRASLEFYGAELGARVIRKHLGWYMDMAGTEADLRRRVLSCRDTSEVQVMLPDAILCERRAA